MNDLIQFFNPLCENGNVNIIEYESENHYIAQLQLKLKGKCDEECNSDDFSLRCNEWVKGFSTLTKTQWIVKKTLPALQRLLFRKQYVCHHSNFNKVSADNRKRIATRIKGKGCEAFIDIKIKKINRFTVRNDPFLEKGWSAIIVIKFKHTHLIHVAEAYSYLKMSNKTKEIFLDYFNKGMGPTAARNYHKGQIVNDSYDDFSLTKALADSQTNPKEREIYGLYDKWRVLREKKKGEIDPKTVQENVLPVESPPSCSTIPIDTAANRLKKLQAEKASAGLESEPSTSSATTESLDVKLNRLKKLQTEKASAGLESEPSTSSATTESFDVKLNSNDMPIEPTPPEFITTQCEETTDSNASVEFLPETEESPLPPQPRQKRPNYCAKEMKTYCRLCLNPTSKNQMVCLGDFHDINYPSRTVQFKRNKILQTEMYLRMIRMLMPNFDHDLVYNPIMCNDCSTRLQMASDFVEQCMATQKLIQQYKDTYCPTDSVVTCEDVVQNKCQISASPSPSTSPDPPPNPKKRKTTKPPGVTPAPQPPEIISSQHIEKPEFVQIKREEFEEMESDNHTNEIPSVDIGNIKEEMDCVYNTVIKTNVEITENDLPIHSIVKSEPSDNIVTNSTTVFSNIPPDVKPNVSTANVSASVPLHPPAPVQYSPPLQPIVPETFVSLVNPLSDPITCITDLNNHPANQNV